MKKMKKINIFIILLISVMFVSCSLDDLQENPNAATPTSADITLLANGVQINFANFVTSAQNQPMGVTRMILMSGVYDNAYSSVSFDSKWRNGYSGLLADAVTLLNNVGSDPIHNNVKAQTQILMSYTLTTLVDYFGDVPYSEAIKFDSNTNPKLDSGEDVYKEALNLLNDAIQNINNNSGSNELVTDMFYGGSMAKWKTLANTLKLRIYNNTRLVDANAKAEINKLILENDLIDTSEEDFVWKYGTQRNDPDTRSPRFRESITRSNYMGQYIMNIMKNTYSNPDPRIYYYFYRQSGTYPGNDEQGLFDRPCQRFPKPLHYTASDPYCNSIGDGYWGRDHGNNEGVPSDEGRITIWGLYPYGTKFDNNSFTTLSETGNNAGAAGQGYFPIFMSSWTSFIKTEAALTLSTDGDPVSLFRDALNKSFNTVKDFNLDQPNGSNVMTGIKINDYINVIITNYNNSNATEKLDLVMKQFYLATWGNGLEAYNNYRRTGYPSDIQPNLESAPGDFIRSFKYPASAVTNNSNINQKPNQSVKVFWDTQTSVNINK
ncbi:SusD/RagB family nutrient-binding outer membrane lipoprotein [Tenacibaculum aiptasiae]|uniref:SusD/RagB family nutrient-binding outer membrane lipoprotein n=2 Tax=Tenacibaculum aiptasiae TaxID=426481 RepID=A0A7J5ADT4_9FLAO|nr:SusD/RagB family nutrient-binding outer membrane lipoprotein [Tenacibaculum aiptasiae]